MAPPLTCIGSGFILSWTAVRGSAGSSVTLYHRPSDPGTRHSPLGEISTSITSGRFCEHRASKTPRHTPAAEHGPCCTRTPRTSRLKASGHGSYCPWGACGPDRPSGPQQLWSAPAPCSRRGTGVRV